MPTKPVGFFKQYKSKIIGSIIALAVVGALPSVVLIHDVYADNRYVMKSEDLRSRIQAIDNSLFEIGQEVTLAETDQEKAKWQARKEYYDNLKEALKERLKSKT